MFSNLKQILECIVVLIINGCKILVLNEMNQFDPKAEKKEGSLLFFTEFKCILLHYITILINILTVSHDVLVSDGI